MAPLKSIHPPKPPVHHATRPSPDALEAPARYGVSPPPGSFVRAVSHPFSRGSGPALVLRLWLRRDSRAEPYDRETSPLWIVPHK